MDVINHLEAAMLEDNEKNLFDEIIEKEKVKRIKRRKSAIHSHSIEGLYFTEEENAMFEMFERESWSSERVVKYINDFVLSKK